MYQSKQYQTRYTESRERQTDDVVIFNLEQQEIVFSIFVKEINETTGVKPVIIAVGDWHVHFLAQFGEAPIRRQIGAWKSMATRALKDEGFVFKRPWAKGCRMVSKPDPKFFPNAFAYIQRHENEGALVYDWMTPREDTTTESSA